MLNCRECNKPLSDDSTRTRCTGCQERYDRRYAHVAPRMDTQSLSASIEPDGVKITLMGGGEGIVSFENISELAEWIQTHFDLMANLHQYCQIDYNPKCPTCNDTAHVVERYNYYFYYYPHANAQIELSKRWQCWNSHEFYTDLYGKHPVLVETFKVSLENLMRKT